MSMLDAFFNKGAFKGAKCKTLLKLTIPRIKLLRNRREIQLKQMRRDIAKLLENGQEATARIRVEHIVREENMMAAQEILELFCELIVVRLPIIETQRECPLDLKEAISSLCFAAPRCSDLPELQQVQMLFAAKYGKEFVQAAAELMPDCGVNRQIIELLSVRAPSVEAKLKLLKEIAAEHEVEWDPTTSETEFLKPHEDLLNGPNHLISSSSTEHSEERHDVSTSSTSVEKSHEQSDSDSEVGLDSLDLPEVPKVSVQPNFDTADSDIAPTERATSHPDMEYDHEFISTTSAKEMPPESGLETMVGPEFSVALPSDPPSVSVFARDSEQFVPFVASPPSSASFPASQSEALPPFPEPVPSAAARLLSSHTFSAKQNEKMSTIPESVPSLSRSKSDFNVDLQDVLAAAQAAAETAERAAAAARLAASLAQVRISELATKRINKNSVQESEYPAGALDQTDFVKEPSEENSLNHSSDCVTKMPTAPFHDMSKLEAESPGSVRQTSAPQPQRSTSLEDDPYFSYPNLFSRQGSTIGSSTVDSQSH
uniref:IST1-like protein n=1 Tax=Anthurium amnicola TaxID=1678845 RepID=A0A1D1YPS7_9ARAE